MQLTWIESRLNEGLILKMRAILDPDDGDDKTVRILIRLVTWVCLSGSRNQVEIEADQCHREILLAQMNLDGANAKSVTTPVVKIQEWTSQILTKIDKDRTSTFRSTTMRASTMTTRTIRHQSVWNLCRWAKDRSSMRWCRRSSSSWKRRLRSAWGDASFASWCTSTTTWARARTAGPSRVGEATGYEVEAGKLQRELIGREAPRPTRAHILVAPTCLSLHLSRFPTSSPCTIRACTTLHIEADESQCSTSKETKRIARPCSEERQHQTHLRTVTDSSRNVGDRTQYWRIWWRVGKRWNTKRVGILHSKTRASLPMRKNTATCKK